MRRAAPRLPAQLARRARRRRGGAARFLSLARQGRRAPFVRSRGRARFADFGRAGNRRSSQTRGRNRAPRRRRRDDFDSAVRARAGGGQRCARANRHRPRLAFVSGAGGERGGGDFSRFHQNLAVGRRRRRTGGGGGRAFSFAAGGAHRNRQPFARSRVATGRPRRRRGLAARARRGFAGEIRCRRRGDRRLFADHRKNRRSKPRSPPAAAAR